MAITTKDIRNVTIAGHNGTGKTSILENILFYSGVISKPELVDSGKTTSDYTEEEISRKISVHAALASVNWNGKTLNFIDAPGTADFIGEVTGAFRSCEAALMIVDARDGAQIETIKLWRNLNGRNKPRAVFLNKMDRERVDFEATFNKLKEEFKMTFVPVTIPMGNGPDYKGVIDIIANKAYFATAFGQKEKEGAIPAEYESQVESFKEALIEAAAEGADDLMEKYLEEMTLDADEIIRGLQEGFKNNILVPVFAGCATNGSGFTALLNNITSNFPNPEGAEDVIVKEDGSEDKITVGSSSDLCALCFKTTIDQFSGKLSFVKVINGSISGESDLYCAEVGKKEKPGKVYRAVGKKLIETDVLCAGDIGIITKSNVASTNCTLLASAEQKYSLKPLRLPSPIYSLAISAGDKKSEDKMNDSLHKVTEEDLTFQVAYNEETKQTTVSGMGELHLNLILDKIRDKQKVIINTKTPKIPYRETITKKSGIVEYAHKKQSGGHGQYGKVLIEIGPCERGQYYTFENIVKGGSVSKGYVPGIEKGLHDQMEEGFLAGYPMVDIGVTLVDGKEHPVDSSEMAFRLAAKGAMKLAIEKAGPVLLEPFAKLAVFIDNQYLGDILSDLSSKRGRVLGQEDLGGNMVQVNAEVPQAEMMNYAIDLKSMTSGTGSFELEFDHYETLAGKMAEDVIKAAKAEAEAEAKA
ncbi:MAG: elongation factor G [Sphaerochaetaceae bacterium]|nr:elongation factor G [Sphaerochaetaceae bacterium]